MPASPDSCTDFHAAAHLHRRELLRVGALSGLGLTLPDLFRSQAQARPQRAGTFGRAKSVIVLYLHGGHAQQETWDPKPAAPSPARGEFGAIATRVPGMPRHLRACLRRLGPMHLRALLPGVAAGG